jgi:wyosine [tRNA(Phe)-imidazoG37] synthetase (radical SAM superfamily)
VSASAILNTGCLGAASISLHGGAADDGNKSKDMIDKDTTVLESIAYGPVPSRRLGQSLGINNIPPKICSYSCLYCQLGKTVNMSIERGRFYEPGQIANSVRNRVEQAEERGEHIDYLGFVPDGEPTLDTSLGREIELLKPFGIKIAVITNASLIWRRDVRQDLQKADWVSLKLDTVSNESWHRLNRPYKTLILDNVKEGMLKFGSEFKGELVTESMLIRGINDNWQEFEKLARFLTRLRPYRAFLTIPTRPPAETTVRAAMEEKINLAYQVFSERLPSVECLVGYEGNAFASTGNIKDDLLSITSVHPMRKEGVMELLKKAGAGWGAVRELIESGELLEKEYEGIKFYIKKLSRPLRR